MQIFELKNLRSRKNKNNKINLHFQYENVTNSIKITKDSNNIKLIIIDKNNSPKDSFY
jgi:alpha-acetolactate decarboxylase